MRRLLTLSRIAVASPAYLARAGVPRVPADLEAHAFLAPSNDVRTHHWTFTDGEREARIHLTPVFSSNSPLMLQSAALEGMGFSILPEKLIERDLASGALCRLLAREVAHDADVDLFLVYPSRRFVNRRVRTFIDHVTGLFDAQP